MKEVFKKTTISIICSSIIAFIIGLIMVVNPDISLKTIGIIVGIYFIVHGIALLVLNYKVSAYFVPMDGIMSGLLSVILGIVLIAMPKILSAALALALGVWIILSSINMIKMAVVIKEEASWILFLFLGLVDLIAGIIILFNPFITALSLTVLAGIVIMVHAIINIIDMIVIKKNVKTITKAIENTIKEI